MLKQQQSITPLILSIALLEIGWMTFAAQQAAQHTDQIAQTASGQSAQAQTKARNQRNSLPVTVKPAK
ncbi:hypothetical protein IQ266_15290 [filamentous cyanobacterium LEGE 11480]|uniref:Uncharacterized protein n=1 Tax=Romeriopsis navalis LEGE 11480 TaxID=2777977 RepID=A0A928Z551_9CYAN|nr:hypothetical protein [Romeriopsis navalis]MBE9031098.1 hypothetical protein [Romeriopsis navalis LEGE 11480]